MSVLTPNVFEMVQMMTPKIGYLSASRPNSSDPRNPQPVASVERLRSISWRAYCSACRCSGWWSQYFATATWASRPSAMRAGGQGWSSRNSLYSRPRPTRPYASIRINPRNQALRQPLEMRYSVCTSIGPALIIEVPPRFLADSLASIVGECRQCLTRGCAAAFKGAVIGIK